jgi:hypothetical protein
VRSSRTAIFVVMPRVPSETKEDPAQVRPRLLHRGPAGLLGIRAQRDAAPDALAVQCLLSLGLAQGRCLAARR